MLKRIAKMYLKIMPFNRNNALKTLSYYFFYLFNSIYILIKEVSD